jgi:hypothetical protein
VIIFNGTVSRDFEAFLFYLKVCMFLPQPHHILSKF